MKRLNDNNKVAVVDLDQDSEEWLLWRNEGLGSSDIALLMLPEPLFDRTVGSLWKQRMGYERTVALDNEHIKRGKELEPKIREHVNNLLGSNFQPECVLRTDSPYLRASLDGIDYDLDAILEIKSPSDKVFEKYLKEWKIPYNYYLQMQYQMLCSDTECAYFAFGREVETTLGLINGDEKELEVYIITVKNDHTLQLDIERRAALFQKGIETHTPVGWKDEVLSFYHTNPTVFVIIANHEQIQTINKIKNPPLPIDILKTGSCIWPIEDFKGLVHLKSALPEHKVKIINLIPSPFSNTISVIELTESGILNHIKSLI